MSEVAAKMLKQELDRNIVHGLNLLIEKLRMQKSMITMDTDDGPSLMQYYRGKIEQIETQLKAYTGDL